MARNVFNATGTLPSTVAPAGTVALPYPAGTTQATFQAANAGTDHQIILNDNDAYKVSDGKLSVSFGASTVTLTNSSTVSWPVGTPYRMQLALLDVDPIRGSKTAAIASPTGGATIDTQARAAIDSIRGALQAAGITA